MKNLRLLIIVLFLLPSQAAAVKPINTNDLKFLISQCFNSFFGQDAQRFKLDRAGLAKRGFTIKRDDSGKLEAFRPTLDVKVIGGTKSIGATFEARRKKSQPNRLRHKSCKLEGVLATEVSAQQAKGLLVAEAKRRGFKGMINKRGNEIWVKGSVVVHLSVLFKITQGQSIATAKPTHIIVDGVHEKELP